MQTYESDANIGNIKILAVDMDKTLLTDERVLPQGLDERLDKLADAGIVFCPASGRPAPKLDVRGHQEPPRLLSRQRSLRDLSRQLYL